MYRFLSDVSKFELRISTELLVGGGAMTHVDSDPMGLFGTVDLLSSVGADIL